MAKKKPTTPKAAKRHGQRLAKKKAIADKFAEKPRCGLCGKTRNLTRTECCGQWICDDEDTYQLFSYARNSCSRNHRRYTLCGYHHTEGHAGRWQDCPKCRDSIEPEMYVYYGTNEYNFEVLKNPPSYEPTHCTQCGVVIVLSEGGYSDSAEGTFCMRCTNARHPALKNQGWS
jgi:hypothetical protein